MTLSLWGHQSMSSTGAVCPVTSGWFLSTRPVCNTGGGGGGMSLGPPPSPSTDTAQGEPAVGKLRHRAP